MELQSPDPGKYIQRELDPVALEFYRRLGRGQLATTACTTCGTTSFPPRRRCPCCDREQPWVELPRRGILHAFTTQETALRFSAPVVLALAELGEAILPGVCESSYDELSIGQVVQTEVRAEPDTGLAVLVFSPENPSLEVNRSMNS